MQLAQSMKHKARLKISKWKSLLGMEGYSKRRKMMDIVTVLISLSVLVFLVASYGLFTGLGLSVLTTILFVAIEWTLEICYLSSKYKTTSPMHLDMEDDEDPFPSEVEWNEMHDDQRD